MKKLLAFLLLALTLTGALAAQDTDFDLSQLETGFQTFMDEVANALPMASTVGLQWSDAYIGQLPKFGVGLSVGASFIPFDDMAPIFEPLGLEIPDLPIPQELTPYLGFPIPAWAFDARLGGIGLPFDIGFKAGFIPQVVRDQLVGLLPEGLSYDYLLIGGDIRIPIIQKTKGAFRPNLSIGGGYTYYHGDFSFVLDGTDTNSITFDVPDENDPLNPDAATPYTYSLSDPEINIFWTAHVIDLKAQFSLKLLWLLTPYIGVGGSYARASAGGGLMTELLDGSGNVVDPETDPVLSAVDDYLSPEVYDLLYGDTGFTVDSAAINGWAFRVYGGLSLNIWVLKLDLSAMYNFLDQSFGATAGIRVQI